MRLASGPPVPPEITGEELDRFLRKELESLATANATEVARHLVALALSLDEDPHLAWEHGKAAVARAGRIAPVREAAGYAAYAAGLFAEALAELRAARRISGDHSTWPVMADCERGLGRPEKALAMAGAPEVAKLDKAAQVEMRLVAAGARRDLGQLEAALVTLSSPDLNNETAPWSARLRYAYADALDEAGRVDEALDWFIRCAEVDEDEETDAEERIGRIQGISTVMHDSYPDETDEIELEVDDES
jgi:tetratricopeptide (TPR) repeat protein